jgi:transposase
MQTKAFDSAAIHRSQAIKNFLAAGAAERMRLERLPAYAPDLNPDEGIWHYLKQVKLKNLCCHDLCQLGQELTAAVECLAAKPEIITACFTALDNYKNST